MIFFPKFDIFILKVTIKMIILFLDTLFYPPSDFLSSKMTCFNKLLKLYKPCQKVGVVEFQLNHIKKQVHKHLHTTEKGCQATTLS